VKCACSGCSHSTGETCGQVFWIKLNQRLHRYRPRNVSYVDEIERVLLNGVISQIPPRNASTNVSVTADAEHRSRLGAPPFMARVGIRQFALLHKKKMLLSNVSTCCEGQATRMLGSLPEYLVHFGTTSRSRSSGALLSVDLFHNAKIQLAPMFKKPRYTNNNANNNKDSSDSNEREDAAAEGCTLTMKTLFPNAAPVTLTFNGCASAPPFALQLRIPSWLAAPTTKVTLSSTTGGLSGGGRRQVQVGRRGEYLQVPRRAWAEGDSVRFSLPMALKVTKYTGRTVVHKDPCCEFLK